MMEEYAVRTMFARISRTTATKDSLMTSRVMGSIFPLEFWLICFPLQIIWTMAPS